MYDRFISPFIKDALKDTPVILISGARQTGKSTLCKQLIEKEIFTGTAVTLDDPTTLAAAKTDPLGFLLSQNKHLIIDEVQRAPEIFLSIKKLVDEDRMQRRYILTGSSEVMALPAMSDSLAGRIEIHHLWPLSQGEIKGAKSNFLDILISENGRFSNTDCSWEELIENMLIGGYPEVLERETEIRRDKWFSSYITAILQKDIKDLANIEGLTQLPNVLQLIAIRAGSTINLSDIARLSGIKNTTLQRYMALLEQVFLINKIPAWTPNAEGKYVKSPKIYINDSGLLSYLRGEGKRLLEDRTTAGLILENFVSMEVIKQITWSDTYLKPYHFSTHKGAEVDIVLEDKHRNLYAIEVKSKASVNEKDFKGLKHFAALTGPKFKKGIVLYSGNQTIGGFGGNNLQAVPISSLWGV
ncbi:ATP-binding protein [Arachidicoccus ginsenosidivorans]|uniref:ATP-binding protein n=1 Tax=Arachidicoccus ginsenosidivorans TaxID=496057 RepID=A0A5B8VI34_9BACT|nr:ATP-binding protein [Arachidicoccus ginsenosidivorans]QEC70843.1 ATP-binding protein [Arachidicoccus ginsenosidivorans]